MTAPAAVEARGLEKTFVGEAGGVVPVLRGLDLEVAEGELVCVLGPTGCGKTTLLRILSGLEPPSAGEVSVAGRAPGEDNDAVGMVFQQNSLLPWRRLDRNVAFPLEMAGASTRAARAKAAPFLRLVGLEGFDRAYPYELSGGMQQRAAIARALAGDRSVLLMDEPFGALDDQTRLTLQKVLLEIRDERRMTVLFVTHNIEEALALGDRIVVLGKGRVLHEEQVDLERPRDRLSPEFSETFLRLRRSFAEAVAPGEGDSSF
jgi:ABC-type nitrate/sulfonate/bicarbonate transport system ATPase subunit